VATAAEELKRVPLFSELSQRQLRRLARRCRERGFRAGAEIVREGQMSGADFFVIAEGKVSVTTSDGKELARLGPGDYFGELALIGERTRLSTVTALEPVRCLTLATWHFRNFVNENPDVSWKLLKHLVEVIGNLLAQAEPARRKRS
jgi:CRP-like cAMP-binding protein